MLLPEAVWLSVVSDETDDLYVLGASAPTAQAVCMGLVLSR